jgi:pimeloyl-ACP methyl ester carboxylesterase
MSERSERTAQERPSPETVSFRGVHGVALAGDAYGDPDAPPVVLLHGGGQTRHAWGRTAADLAGAGWRAYSLDLRGHGDSDWSPDGIYHVQYLADDLLEVLDELGRPAALVGASLGGMTSLLVAGELRPEAVRALVLVDIVHRSDPDGAQRIGDFMRSRPDGFATLDEAADAVANFNPHRPRPRDPTGLRKNLRQRDDGRWYWHWDPSFLRPGYGPGGNLEEERLTECARQLAMPTLLVRGRLSDIVSEDGAREFLALVPHAAFVDVRDAGHMVAGDRNDVFSEAVLGFLATVRDD